MSRTRRRNYYLGLVRDGKQESLYLEKGDTEPRTPKGVIRASLRAQVAAVYRLEEYEEADVIYEKYQYTEWYW